MPPKPDPTIVDFPTYQPTPTQEENDLAAVGQTVIDKEPDGSEPPDAEPKPGHRPKPGERT